MSRTQQDRSEATRSALVSAGRQLFAESGYNAVGIEAVVREAGVTRGALYHLFEDKVALFVAVFEQVEEDLVARLAGALPDGQIGVDMVELLYQGIDAWLDACADPEVRRIVLLDGPSVLGWERWREIELRYGVGLVEALLAGAMDEGAIDRMPLRAATHVLIGALDEAAMFVMDADDPVAARTEVTDVLRRLLGGLAAPGYPT
jgi:AcrR family transcriptional regulator